jgi:hypothetical protein
MIFSNSLACLSEDMKKTSYRLDGIRSLAVLQHFPKGFDLTMTHVAPAHR